MSDNATPEGLVVFRCPACRARLSARMADYLVRFAVTHPCPPSEVLLTVQCRSRGCGRIVEVRRADVRLAA